MTTLPNEPQSMVCSVHEQDSWQEINGMRVRRVGRPCAQRAEWIGRWTNTVALPTSAYANLADADVPGFQRVPMRTPACTTHKDRFEAGEPLVDSQGSVVNVTWEPVPDPPA